jgi:GTPase Era involved in 16S rRNA processing
MFNPHARICLIDTPGVDFALKRNHMKLTHNAIIDEKYDKLIYVLDAGKLGTDSVIKHLKFVYKNVPTEKVIFVLNKLDLFKSTEDSISGSMEGVKADLQKIGFKNPIICPLSAYFSYLLKMKQNKEKLKADEQDIFDLYVKKFNKPEYDLSAYYNKHIDSIIDKDDEMLKMSFISGLYGLENIIYGVARK